jgi:hypothetical protein
MRLRNMLCALCVLALGCSDDEAQRSRACGEQGCSAACEQLRGEGCDILQAACQRRIFDAVVCVRGTPGELPEMRVITQEEYRAELLASVGDEDAGVEEQARDDAWSTGLALIGLLDPEESASSASIDDRVDNVAGYYSGDERSITLIDRGDAEDSDDAQSLLAHELVHALQDQQMGLRTLDDRTARTNDSFLARNGLIEGEATLYEDLAISLLHGLEVDPSYWDVNLAWRLRFAQGTIASARSPYSRLWQLNYPVGARFVTDAWLSGGNRAVHGIYWAVPQSTIYWMHGYRAVVEREGQLLRPLACRHATAPSGYRSEWDVSMGPYGVYAFLVHAFNRDGIAPIEAAWQDALLWRQDSLTIFMNEAQDGVAVSWRILFEDAEVASRIAGPIGARFEGAELEVRAAEPASLLLDWVGPEPDACPDE